LIIGATGIATTQVYAQDGDAMEEITVTARKREERMQDVPISMAVFSSEDLEARSISSLKELGQVTTNFSFYNHGQFGRGGAIVYMRGIGQEDPDIYWDPGVGVYVDGAYNGRMQGVDLDLMDLERVEILRGPQGTLFGRNTIGGAVNAVTAKPTDDFHGTAEITMGRFNRLDGKASINIPLVPDKMAMKIAAASRNRDGYSTRLDFNTGEETGELGDKDSASGRMVINWTPTDEVGLLLSVDTTRAREGGSARTVDVYNPTAPLSGLLNLFVDPDYGDAFLTDSKFTSFADGTNATDLDTLGIALTVDWDLGSWAVKSITSYRDTDMFSGVDPDGSFYNVIDFDVDIEHEQFSQELQFSGLSFDNRLNWVLGLYYFDEDGFNVNRVDVYRDLLAFSPPLPRIDPSFTSHNSAKAESYALFSQGTFSISDKLSVTGGLRWTYDKKVVSAFRFAHLNNNAVVLPQGTKDKNWDALSGRAGLEYRWNDGIMTYFSVARGYKSGGINGRPVSDFAFSAFEPEFLWTYELGVKSDWLDNRLRLNGAIFFTDYKDMQFQVIQGDPATGVPITVVDNAAQSEVRGFELDLVAVPATGLTLTASVGYLDAEYTELDPTSILPISVDNKFVKTPKWSTTLSGEYALPIKDWGELRWRLDYSHKSEIHHDAANSLIVVQDGYGVLNARLTFDSADGNWAVSLFGTNLTDERYLMGGTDFLNVLGFAEMQYARPREWGVSLKFNF
jgi:iron complex outermembrane receptor protein